MERDGEPRARHGRWWWIAIALVVFAPFGVVTARQLAPSGGSPATGSAQVVTQGIAELPGETVAWRLVERTAPIRGHAKLTRRQLGFVLASDEPILLTDKTPDGTDDVARLAPGEAYLVKDGTRQARASFTDQPVKYLALELVPAADVDDIGSGKLLYKSDPFPAPAGERDLDLVRNVLEVGESASVPDTGESTVILATDGAIDILPDGGPARTLQAGESAQFEAGALQIEAIAPTASVAKRIPAAALTDQLQDASTAGAAYVVAVIGEEIPPPPTPTPTSTPTATPTATPTPVPPTATPTELPVTTGSIGVTVYNCPDGMTVENMVGDACNPAAGGYGVVLSTPDGGTLTLDNASSDGVSYFWTDLGLGQYGLAEDPLPRGYVTYFIPGSAAVGGSPETGYSVELDESAPDIGLAIYNFRPVQYGSVAVLVFNCPLGQTPDDFSPTACPPAKGGYVFELIGPTAVTSSDADPIDGGFVWGGIPFGSYGLREVVFPRGYGQNVAPGYSYDEGLGGYGVEVGPNNPNVTVAVYNFLAG